MLFAFLTSLLLATSCLFPFQKIHASEKKLSWTPEAMMQTKGISDVQLSPDNESVLFVVKELKMTDEQWVYLSRIYRGSVKNCIPIPFSTVDVSSMQPRWAPNGEWIAFISNREGTKNLYLISSNGGEAIPLTNAKKDIQTFSWSPDGKKIAFVMADEIKKEKTSLAHVCGEENIINRLWLLDIFSPKPSPKPLTTDNYHIRGWDDGGTIFSEFDWSPDSNEILFTYCPSAGDKDYTVDSSLATVNITTGNIIPWEKKARYEATPRYSPDGTLVAYLSDDSPEIYLGASVLERRFFIEQDKIMSGHLF